MQKTPPRVKKEYSTEAPKPSFIHSEKFKVGVPTAIAGLLILTVTMYYGQISGNSDLRNVGMIFGILVGIVPLTLLQFKEVQRKDSIAAVSFLLAGGALAADTDHFHPKGKPPSEHTLEVLREARATLPFADKRDFDEEKKGFIAAPESWQIMANAGNVAWDMERYKFFLEGKDFDSIHPSLQRQGH